MTPEEMARVQSYLQDKFQNKGFAVKGRKTEDSIEVYLDNEFIGVIYKDDEDGDISYDFNMAILEMDLPNVA